MVNNSLIMSRAVNKTRLCIIAMNSSTNLRYCIQVGPTHSSHTETDKNSIFQLNFECFSATPFFLFQISERIIYSDYSMKTHLNNNTVLFYCSLTIQEKHNPILHSNRNSNHNTNTPSIIPSQSSVVHSPSEHNFQTLLSSISDPHFTIMRAHSRKTVLLCPRSHPQEFRLHIPSVLTITWVAVLSVLSNIDVSWCNGSQVKDWIVASLREEDAM